jgi:hypothetical protein
VTRLLEQLGAGAALDRHVLRDLRRMGDKAAGAVDRLVELFESHDLESESRAHLAFAIACITPTRPAARQMLEDPDAEVRRLALAGLCDQQHKPADLRQILHALLLDEDRAVRLDAAEYLWKVRGEGLAAARAIVRELPELTLYECKDREIFGGTPLAALRDQWGQNLKLLLEIAAAEPSLADEASAAWREQPKSLNLARLHWELSRDAAALVPELSKIVVWHDFRETVASFELLYRMGPAAAAAVPALRDMLKHRYWLYRLYAVQTLGSVGPAAQCAAGDLVNLLDRGVVRDEDLGLAEDIRLAAADALGKMFPGLPNLAPALRRVIDNAHVRWLVAGTPALSSASPEEDVRCLLGALADRFA